MVVNAQVNGTNKTTLGSERRSVVENSLTGPTLLEMSGFGVYQDFAGFLSSIIRRDHDPHSLIF